MGLLQVEMSGSAPKIDFQDQKKEPQAWTLLEPERKKTQKHTYPNHS